ncbi:MULTISPECIES: BTAD domain-containing putative transcriptional regulator [unclassified Streptomyces]|uniref:AfsR/SARP family transcriptional regulator n=1 Tax=unclassified Streptomyces TaxID=2593676 RepID=UPI002ED52EA0|nr:AfsR family transcriptional regulator [Streptomyces sp. NBC_00891]WSY06428.1 AfsR family transcriptional regulator [Streptomyces sp. NBC_00890]WSZ08052.1 AfsR family transcriptional regulator [Streptomyces sp. NBC_00869]WSZ24448.1 AfsR family transcriptional regulator [Streptomyces sp. NBC_00870]
MEFRLLGTVCVDTLTGPLPLGPAKRRSLLAALLLHANTPVSMARLTDCLWDDEPPLHARTVIQGHVSRLRALLMGADSQAYGVELATLGDAYVLRAPETLLDSQRFEELLMLAREQRDPSDAVLMLKEALSLWQGPALTGTYASAPLQAAAHALEESRLSTVEQLARAYGELGEHHRAAAVLRAEAVAHPMRESLAAGLMTALYLSGRQSEALDWFHRTRRLLADELGIDPGRELADAYARILRGEGGADAPVGAGGRGAPGNAGRPGGRGGPGSEPGGPGHARGTGAQSGTEDPGAPARGAAAGAVTAGGAGSFGPGTGPGASAHVPGAGTRGTGDHPLPAGPPGTGGAPADTPGPEAATSGGTQGSPAAPHLSGRPQAVAPRAAAVTPHAPPSPYAAGAPAPAPAADLLPRAPRGFHGRGAELTALSRAAAGEAPVCLVTGPAGVGKTALALHWARRTPAAFPDGRLFADLRGFGDTAEPTPLEVLREFLLALGVAPRRVPESVAGAAALFRSLTDRLSLLVVLDNARDSAQVRPLLPGGADCVTLVTSRRRLEGLIASDAAVPVPLDILEPPDGTALLAGVLGEERVLAEPVAARRLAELCGGLPLALRVTAARLAGRPQWTLAAMADELADERSRLSYLDVEDTGVSAALRLTVQQLPPDAVHHLARLGHHPGGHFDPYTAAALAGSDPVTAGAALERLAAAHLVSEAGPGRWILHDLVRLYARGLDPAAGPDALMGVLDHYIATALAAADTAEPGGEPCFVLPDDFRAPAATRDFTDRATAMSWLAAEREDLTLAAAAARSAGLDDRAWRIILLQWPHVVWRVRDGWTPMLELALAAAVAREDPYAESRVRNLLGWVLTEEGRTNEAVAMLEPSPGLARHADDRLGEATALINLAIVQAEQGGLHEAMEGCERARELAAKEPDAHTEMLALQHLARMQLAAGRPQDALDSARTAFDLGPEHEEAARRVLLLSVSGEARLALGAEEEGIRLLDQAATEAEAAGYDEGAVRALEALLRVTAGPDYVRRHAEAARRLTADG